MARGKKSCNLYVFQACISSNFVNSIKGINVCDPWHKRLSHITERGLDCLREKNLLSGLKDAKIDMSEHCLLVKQTRLSFKYHHSLKKKCIWMFAVH